MRIEMQTQKDTNEDISTHDIRNFPLTVCITTSVAHDTFEEKKNPWKNLHTVCNSIIIINNDGNNKRE